MKNFSVIELLFVYYVKKTSEKIQITDKIVKKNKNLLKSMISFSSLFITILEIKQHE